MGVQEIKDEFLLSMGCSISNRYNYINDDGYDYFAKLEEKDVKINNKNIPVRKAIGNTMLLNSDLALSGLQAMLKVAEEINSVNSNNDSIAKLGNYTMEVGKVYFTDWLKYATNKLKIDEQLSQYMISLITSASATLNDNVMEILNKHQINLSNAKMEAMNWQNQRNAEISTQALNAPKTTFAVTDTREPLVGRWATSYTFATTKSTVTEGMLRGQFQSSSVVADIMSKNRENSAYQKATGELGQVIENIILRFNEQLMELLVMKLPNLFSEDVLNNNKNLELNPTNREEWLKIIPELNDAELQELKKLNKFYGIGLKEPLEERLAKDIYNYYIKDLKNDFNNNDFKLYLLIKEQETKTFPEISSKMYDYFYDEIWAKNTFKLTESAKKSETLWNENKKAINECEYLTEEHKKELIKECDHLIEFWVKKHNLHTSDIKTHTRITIMAFAIATLAIVFYGKIVEFLGGSAFWDLLLWIVIGISVLVGGIFGYIAKDEKKDYKKLKKED